MKVYKATNQNHTAKHGNDVFEVGKTYEIQEDQTPELCRRGYHGSENISDVFNYYKTGSLVFEVEITGDLDLGVDKICGRKLEVLYQLTPVEIEEKLALDTLNTDGKGNRGSCNRGSHNRGNHNRGNHNRGDNNRGDNNRGDHNRGDWNRGDWNRGSCNRGDDNRGDHNRGDYSWGIGCTGPTMVPCFDGALMVPSDNIPSAVYALAKDPENDRYYAEVLALGALPRKLQNWRRRFIVAGE